MTTDRPREVGCKCEHWQVCPRCYPQGTFDDAGRLIVKSDNPTQIADRLARYGDADAAAELRRLYAENERLREAIALAYGHLWHVNNEPAAPIPLRSPEKAAYEARKVLRDLIATPERGNGIEQARAALAKETTNGS